MVGLGKCHSPGWSPNFSCLLANDIYFNNSSENKRPLLFPLHEQIMRNSPISYSCLWNLCVVVAKECFLSRVDLKIWELPADLWTNLMQENNQTFYVWLLGPQKWKQREEGSLIAWWKTDFSNIWNLEANSDLFAIQLELKIVGPSLWPDPCTKPAMGVRLDSSFTSHLSAKLLSAMKVVWSFWRLEVSKHGSDDHLPSSREHSKPLEGIGCNQL